MLRNEFLKILYGERRGFFIEFDDDFAAGATDEHGFFRRLDVKCICANLRDLWETTKRPMRLKKQMGEFAHRSQTITDAMRRDGQKR